MSLSIKLLILIGIALAGFLSGHHQAEIEQQALHARALEQAQEREHELVLKANDIATQLLKAQDHAETRKNSVLYGLRSGAVRLSIPSASCASQGPATAAGNQQEARAQLDGPTAEALVSIATDGDRAINQLNACIDAYNEVTK